MSLKLKTLSDCRNSVGLGDNRWIPVVVKRKVILMEREFNVGKGDLKAEVDEYMGTITYVPENPLVGKYVLTIEIEDYAAVYFKEAMELFFSETKGLFVIPSGKKYDIYYHTLLVKEVGFTYKKGIYSYKSV